MKKCLYCGKIIEKKEYENNKKYIQRLYCNLECFFNHRIEKSQKGAVTTEVTLDESVTAPVSQGQRLGTLTVKCGDQVLKQVPMVAETAVTRLTFWDIFLSLLKQMVGAK